MTKKEIITLIRSLQQVFEVARLVNVSRTGQYIPDENDEDLVPAEYECYAVWNKEHRCENCISAKAFVKKDKFTKFEFIEDDVYHVVAKYVEVEGTPYVLELVTNITDNVLFGAFGKENFVEKINSFNRKLYMDPLTGAYNRNYYNEQLKGLTNFNGLAIMDMDKFKDINDTYGHQAGDWALKQAASVAIKSIRSSDSVIRYGGDEFLILFSNINFEIFNRRLEEIRSRIEESRVEEYPDLTMSVSIGGYFCDGTKKISLKDADDMLYKAKEKRNCVVTREG